MHGIKNGIITAYNPQADYYNEFKTPINYKEITIRLGGEDKEQVVEDPETGELITRIIPGTYNSKEVKEYLVKEMWFFDRQRAVMDVRIIAICPVRYYSREANLTIAQEDEILKKQLFWVSFEQARSVLANHESFNANNDAEHRTFEDVFLKRIFSSYVYQESNMYNNRMVEEYTEGVEAMVEADRIKTNISNFEIDMWNY